MKNVYAIQLSNWPPSCVLPQAIGTIWSYAYQHEDICQNYQMKRVFWENQTPETIINEIIDPDVLMCSCYTWNWAETNQVIIEIKQKYPNCLVIIGGPEPKYNMQWMQENPAVDILIPYYGEQVFTDVLVANLTNNFNDVNGIITKDKQSTGNINFDFSNIPSPYLNGFFDWLLENKIQSTKQIRCVFESNRGCPFSCTFCDIGAMAYQKIKRFDIQRCKDELEWMVKNNIVAIDVADANFGIFDVDEEFVDHLITLKKKYKWNGRFLPTFAKVKGDNILKIANKIIENELDSIFGISLQSVNPNVLKAIKRKNPFTLDEMTNIILDMNSKGTAVYTELVFPLPNDTKKEFINGLEKLIDMPQPFNKFQINQTNILTNSELNDNEYIEKFGLTWKSIKGFTRHYYGNNIVDKVATSTSTISEDEVWDCIFMSKCFYIPLYYYGIARTLCDDLHPTLKRSKVLEKIYNHLCNVPWFLEFYKKMRQHYFNSINNREHFGHIITTDKSQYWPEYAVAHRTYIDNDIFSEIKKVFPQHTDIINFDQNSIWTGNSIDRIVEKNNKKYHILDDRNYDYEDYLMNVYIIGRFNDTYKVKQVKEIND